MADKKCRKMKNKIQNVNPFAIGNAYLPFFPDMPQLILFPRIPCKNYYFLFKIPNLTNILLKYLEIYSP